MQRIAVEFERSRGGHQPGRLPPWALVVALSCWLALGASVAFAQPQPQETLPGFKAENVFEVHGIDNVNLFNGDPGIVIPLGPEYTLGPNFKWQLKAYYSAKFWTMSVCSPDYPTYRFAWIRGDPTIGLGWNLQLGYWANYGGGTEIGSAYFSPDGGLHDLLNFPVDGTHLRIGGSTVEYPDGSIATFGHSFASPRPVSGSSPDFTYRGYAGTDSTRAGLTTIQDSFRKTVLRANYDTTYSDEITSIVLTENTQLRTIYLHWKTFSGSSVSWRVMDYIDFPTSASATLRVTFNYQDGSFRRNNYDNSLPTGPCPPQSPVPDVPELTSITFSDPAASPSFASFSYSMNYFTAPSGDPIPVQQQGALQRLTLPTGGYLQYEYSITGGMCSCDPEFDTGVPDDPALPGGAGFFQRFLDKSLAVTKRTEYDSTANLTFETDYARRTFFAKLPAPPYDPDTQRFLRRTTVTTDALGATPFATRQYFHVDVDGDQGAGIELDRRYYPASSTSVPPVRTVISCYGNPTPRCGYKDASGTIQIQGMVDLLPKQAEVTWYGAVPSGLDGGTCSAQTVLCTGSSNTTLVSTSDGHQIGKYKTNTVATTLVAMPGWSSRATTTDWTPQISPEWLLDLFDYKQVTDGGNGLPSPSSMTTNYTFNTGNGYLTSFSTTDSYGTLTHTFSASPDSLGNPTTRTVSGSWTGSGSFTDNWSFNGASGLLTSNRTGISWNSFDVNRDSGIGLITTSKDPNSSLSTAYAYDALGRIKSITPPGGEASTYVCYDTTTKTVVARSTSTLTCPINPGTAGVLTWQQYLYDSLGRSSREIRQMPSGYSVRRHAYDAAAHEYFVSEWATCTSATGDCLTAPTTLGTTSSNFDPFGRPQTITKADGSVTTIDRTDGGISFSDWRESVTVNVNGSPAATVTRKDILGRVIYVVEPTGDLTSYTYNALDKLACVDQPGTFNVTDCTSNSGGQYRAFTYDSFGFLRKEVTPEKGTVDLTGTGSYDSLGNVLTRTEAYGTSGAKQHNYSYDSAGRLLSETVGTSNPVTYLTNCYDGSGGCYTGGTYPKGKLTRQIATNPLFKPLYPTTATSETVSLDFDYSGLGGRISSKIAHLPTGATDGAIESWVYNTLGLVSTHNHPRVGGGVFQEQFTYTSGLPTQIQLATGCSGCSTEYDGSAVPGATFTAAYWPSGGLGSYTASLTGSGNTLTTTITQDSTLLPRPVQILSKWNSTTKFDTGGYSYDGVGNITTIGVALGGSPDTFTYDSRSRLISAKYAGQTTFCNSASNQCFAYDLYGNLTGVTGTNPRTLTTSTATNRLTSGTYDYRGNLTSFSPDSLTFDDLNRQIENVSTGGGDWQYLYDGGNERTVKTTTASGGSLVPRREIARYLVQAGSWSTTTACTEGSQHFTDVHCADTDWKFIQTFYEHGLNTGCTSPNYCPETNVKRDTMAFMLLRAEHGTGWLPPACTPPGIFADVTCPGTYTNWIEQVYREGIVPACQTSPTLKYCPTATVTETNMLTYLSNFPSANCPVSGVSCYHPIAGGSTYTLRDQQNHVVTEFYGPFAARDNIFLGNVLVASYADKQPTLSGNWQFSASDHLGSLRFSLKGSDGSTVECHKYWPYGDEVSLSPPCGTPAQRLTFATMERDTEASHFYDHARTHDFNLGRFLGPDKLGGRTGNPQSWNRYTYALNNPLKLIDPNGLDVVYADEYSKQTAEAARSVSPGTEAALKSFESTTEKNLRVETGETSEAPSGQTRLEETRTYKPDDPSKIPSRFVIVINRSNIERTGSNPAGALIHEVVGHLVPNSSRPYEETGQKSKECPSCHGKTPEQREREAQEKTVDEYKKIPKEKRPPLPPGHLQPEAR